MLLYSFAIATARKDTRDMACTLCSICGVHLETNKWTAECEASESRVQTLADSLANFFLLELCFICVNLC